MTRQATILLGILLTAGLFIKAGYLISIWPEAANPALLSTDELYHYNWAMAIADGQLFANAPYFRAPLYPYFLAILLWLFQGSLVLVRIVQLSLGLISLFLIFRLGQRIVSPWAGFIGGMLYLLYPVTTFFESQLLLDGLFSLLVLAVIYCLYPARESVRIHIISASVFYALAALTRPTILALLPLMIGYLWLRYSTTADRLRSTGIFVVVVMLLLVPVTVINYTFSGQFIPVAYQGGVNFYIGNNSQADGVSALLPPFGSDWTLADTDYMASTETGREIKYNDQSDFWYAKAFDFIREYPGKFTELTLRKIGLLLSGTEISNNRPLDQVVFGNALLGKLPVRIWLILALAVVPLFLQKTRRKTAGIYAAIIFYGLVISLFFISSRFRLPLIGPLAVLGGSGLVASWEFVREHRFTGRMVLAGLGTVSMLAISLVVPAGRSFINPNMALFLRGNADLRAGDFKQAIARYDSIIKAGTYIDNAYLNVGIARLKLGDGLRAREAFEQELLINPSSAEAANNLGVMARLAGSLDTALVYFKRALTAEPYHPMAAINLLKTVRNLGDTASAGNIEPLRRKARQHLSNKPDYLFQEGVYFAWLQRYPEAIDNQMRVIDVIKHSPPSIAFGGMESGLFGGASDDELMAMASYQLGYIFGLTGRYQESIRYSREAIELNPELREAYINLISGYRSVGEIRRADSVAQIYISTWGRP